MIVKGKKLFNLGSFFGIFGILLSIIGINFGYCYINFVSIYVIILSVYLICSSRHNTLLIILFSILAYCNYSIVFSNYLNIVENTMYTQYVGTEVWKESIYIILLFMALMTFFLSISNFNKFRKNSSANIKFENDRNSNQFLSICLISIAVVLILIFIFGFKKPTETGERGSPSTLYEYAILLFIICFYFSNKKFYKISIIIILIMFSVQNFIYGGRITGLQLIIVLYIMVLEKYINIKKMIPFAIAGFLGMSVVGSVRGYLMSGDISLSMIFENLKNKMFTLDTAYSAYYTSMTFIKAEDFTSNFERFNFFINFLKSIIFGGYSSENVSVAHYTIKYFHHNYGGILPFFFHFYFGWSGVVIISIYVAFLINKISKLNTNSSGISKCIGVFVVASTFRWYLYFPITITRSILILGVCYYILNIFSRYHIKK